MNFGFSLAIWFFRIRMAKMTIYFTTMKTRQALVYQ